MSMYRPLSAIVSIAALLLLVFAGPGRALGQDAEALIKEANNTYRQAERQFHNGKHQDALKLIESAAEMVAQAKEAEPNNLKISQLETKITHLTNNIRKRLPQEEAPAASEGTEQAGGDAAGSSGKLPSGVAYRLREAERFMKQGEQAVDPSSAERSPDWRSKTAEHGAEMGRGALVEIEEKFAGQYDPEHPELVAFRARIEALEGAAKVLAEEGEAAKQEGEAAKAESDVWQARLAPYLAGPYSPEHDPEKYFIASATQDMEEMQTRLMRYGAVKQVFAEYQGADLAVKSDQLLQLEKDFVYALESFEDGVVQNARYNLESAENDLKHAMDFLITNKAKADKGEKFLTLGKDQLQYPMENLERGAALLEPDHADVTRLRQMIKDINKLDAELRKKAVADTRMLPDKFKGGELKELKKLATSVVEKEHSDAKVQRVTIISEDWNTESVIEYTDTTRSALRHRVTRRVTAQVGATRGGDGHLYTVYLASDRQADGKWGTLKGHVMFDDPILKQNIDK